MREREREREIYFSDVMNNNSLFTKNWCVTTYYCNEHLKASAYKEWLI